MNRIVRVVARAVLGSLVVSLIMKIRTRMRRKVGVVRGKRGVS